MVGPHELADNSGDEKRVARRKTKALKNGKKGPMTYAKRAQSGQGTVLGTGASSETGGQVQSMLSV